MVLLNELVAYCDDLLDVAVFHDYAPNGLQVEGVAEVKKIVSGVTACQALIDAAVESDADVLLVHHGFFWKGENECITGIKRRRIAKLIENNISLIAYHLPLDAHPELGNNAQLAKQLGVEVEGRFGRGSVAMFGRLPKKMSAGELQIQLGDVLDRKPMHLCGESADIQRIAWCTGAAQGYIDATPQLGVQAFISGEVSEQTTHFARESGVHFFAAGHHATERYGVKALGNALAKKFLIGHKFIDIDNPV